MLKYPFSYCCYSSMNIEVPIIDILNESIYETELRLIAHSSHQKSFELVYYY